MEKDLREISDAFEEELGFHLKVNGSFKGKNLGIVEGNLDFSSCECGSPGCSSCSCECGTPGCSTCDDPSCESCEGKNDFEGNTDDRFISLRKRSNN